MSRRDILEYDYRFLPVWLGQPRENGSGDFLRLVEFADLRIGRDALGIKPAGKLAGDAAICAECLTLCREIHAEQLT